MSDRRPHDVTDLYLAPVAIELDRRLSRYEGLTEHEIDDRVALATNREPDGPTRSQLVLAELSHTLENHGWRIGWVPRGLELRHGDHALVLGVPDSLRDYLADR